MDPLLAFAFGLCAGGFLTCVILYFVFDLSGE